MFFKGDQHSLQIYDPTGELVVDAGRNNKGFWAFEIITEKETEVHFKRAEVDRHFTREQITRAKEARMLHCLLGHTSDSALTISLDHGSIVGTHLTSSDIRNARALLGPCESCIIGKRRNPSMHSSFCLLLLLHPENIYMAISFPSMVYR